MRRNALPNRLSAAGSAAGFFRPRSHVHRILIEGS